MKTLLASLALLAASSSAHAAVGMYECKLSTNPSLTASLEVLTDGSKVTSVTWMPGRGLKTSKANSNQVKEVQGGLTQVMLFGFQDQADMLELPAGIASLPSEAAVSTYHDDDGYAVDNRAFSCSQSVR